MSQKIPIPGKEILFQKYFEELKDLPELANIYNTSPTTIKKWINYYGGITRTKPQKKLCSNVVLLKQLIEKENKFYYEAGQIFGVSSSLINTWCKKYNIQTNNDPHKKIEIPSYEELYELYIEKGLSCLDLSKRYNVSNVTVKKWLKEKGIILRTHSQSIKSVVDKISETKIEKYGYVYFPPDLPFNNTSKGELELKDFLNENGFNFEKNKQILNGLELDLYDEDEKFAIEYNGEYYHTEGPPNFRDKNYHKRKYDQCNELGIRIIFINENEWKNRNKQVKNFLLGSLGVSNRCVYARQCNVKRLDIPNIQFLEDNHIQGAPKNIIVMYGLFYNDQMVGAITYSNHHRQRDKLVLSRLCFLYNWKIIGGASKLFKNSVKQEKFDSIITWSDNRLTLGNVYHKMGFIVDEKLNVDYCYINRQQIKSKQSMQKTKIGCPKNTKEHIFLKEKQWYRMWDCGKIRWIWNKPE